MKASLYTASLSISLKFNCSIKLVSMSLKCLCVRTQLSQNKLLSEVKKIGRKFICPHCGSKNTHWKGYRKTLKGRKRLRKCTDCRRKFSTKILL